MNQIVSRGRIAFVTGGSGFVGNRLIKALIENKWEVRALVRSTKAEEEVRKLGAISVLGDLRDYNNLRRGMDGCEVVYHVAAHFKLWGNKKDFDSVNIEGTRLIVKAAVDTLSVKRVVSVSAAAVVMGDPEPMSNVDESAPLQVRSFAPYSASKAEAERILLQANSKRFDFTTIAIRPPMIWGPDMPTLEHMVETVKSGKWQWVDGGNQSMSTCHVDNLIAALLLACDRGNGGQAYFVADAETGTLKSVISDLLNTRDVNVPDKSVPFNVAWIMAGILSFAWRIFKFSGEPAITHQMLRLIGKPFTISHEKARNELGYTPVISWTQGISSMKLKQDIEAASSKSNFK